MKRVWREFVDSLHGTTKTGNSDGQVFIRDDEHGMEK